MYHKYFQIYTLTCKIKTLKCKNISELKYKSRIYI